MSKNATYIDLVNMDNTSFERFETDFNKRMDEFKKLTTNLVNGNVVNGIY